MSHTSFPILFSPTHVGPMRLRSRVMVPPHAMVVGDLFGTLEQARANVAYWASRAADGAAWIDGITGFVENILVPGFLPTGVGARAHGIFRSPLARERLGMYASAIHAEGAYATCQLVLQGGMPHGPSALLANHTNNSVPHALSLSEIEWLIDEYAFSAGVAQEAGLDGVELHANHEDLLQLFLSPATNQRDDAYGGDFERRLRFVTEIIAAIRSRVGAGFVIGARFNMDELFPGGYDAQEGLRIARALAATGQLDYLHCVMGNNWGAPSYIQPHHYGAAQWSELAGAFRAALPVPVVYTGRVSDPATAEAVLAAGHADVVGIARAYFAEPQILTKARAGQAQDIRPCIGCNDCLHTRIVDGLPFGCTVNPGTGRELVVAPARPSVAKRVLIVGGGPAGMELAAVLAERGHRPTLWEQQTQLGGQMAIAAVVSENASFTAYLDFQRRRLETLGVAVELGRRATLADARASGADVVAIATGAQARRLIAPGVASPFVVEGREVMQGHVQVGQRVVVIAMEDHLQPLTVASYLVERGHQVELVYATTGVAPLVGKYSIGAIMAKLARGGARVRVLERVVSIEPGCVHTRNVYADTAGEIRDVDSVVLACGGMADDSLYRELDGQVPQLHLLGDAYAPRRLWFAIRQGYELAQKI